MQADQDLYFSQVDSTTAKDSDFMNGEGPSRLQADPDLQF